MTDMRDHGYEQKFALIWVGGVFYNKISAAVS